ncbi:DUF3173 family protein [Streptococcus ratti]|uniref:DUF3173 domain-containing protein n=1 Tax=Streptococcus ratti FA-1 = DSM 20564 TaxID=699248 RepID=A0ABN0GVZ5_STRRT|nr:DUF3173 family protein [Streptococcus ratti]EJN94425.1 hypothetical protein SRA_07806 [Streptococcus ratti FA-1 = DSM 20564]EMP70049.1 hypothetical protein D822_05636 [Streptococcus ratti FA-1 = DSM 20564]QEY06366.1 DUF3173 domain-containing protein [Streptococcus ratti]VEI60709.1 hyptothetic protein [Streptococcus mutans]
MINIVDKDDLMVLTGYSQSQCKKLIRKAKIKLVSDGFSWYDNKRVGRVPIKTIEDILGFKLSYKNGIIHDVLQNAGLHDTGEQQ